MKPMLIGALIGVGGVIVGMSFSQDVVNGIGRATMAIRSLHGITISAKIIKSPL